MQRVVRGLATLPLPVARGSVNGPRCLLGLPGLPDALALRSRAAACVEDCSALLAAAVAPSTPALERLALLDRASQRICNVIDPAEVLRFVHPDARVRAAAEDAIGTVATVIARLNTDRRLYEATLDAQRGAAGLTEEAQRVAESLRIEFEAHGIHLHDEARERVVALTVECTSRAYEVQAHGSGLAELLAARRELARLLGQPSYAHLALQGRVFQSVPQVLSMLDELERAAAVTARRSPVPSSADAVFVTLNDVVRSLEQVCARTFGVELAVVKDAESAAYAPHVWELQVRDARSSDVLGHVLLDPLARRGKVDSVAATYMLSFRVGNQDEREAETALNRCALVTSVRDPQHVSLAEAVQLFHEWGHVMHALLSRTHYQHLAGTRGPVDFVEVPSLLMERFALAPGVLCGVDAAAVERFRARAESAADVTQMVHLARVDLQLHGPEPPPPALVESMRSFSHLGPYGASYYSYAACTTFARRIWEAQFSSGRQWDHVGGQRVIDGLLRWGGARDPHAMVAECTMRHA